MKKKDRQQLEYEIYQAYTDLDEVFAVIQVLRDSIKSENSNKWTNEKVLNSLLTLLVNIQSNLEQILENKDE
jgi:hypothetical protein